MTKIIQVFEHQTLKVGQHGLTDKLFDALQRHYGNKGKPYYSLIHQGIRFNQYVGVIQINDFIIEVLPKIDKQNGDNQQKSVWQKKLIEMLLVVNQLNSKISSYANLNIKSNSILAVYFEIFIIEVESLLHKGLFKQYHKQQANCTALKGRLNFSQHLRKNSVHKEQFFVEYTTYDPHNIYNQIIYKTLKLIHQLADNTKLINRINLLLINFPNMDDISVNKNTFERMKINRKNQYYQVALTIAELILLNYHPDVVQGKRAVLALMFDMNQLWEKFVLISLQRNISNNHIQIKQQQSKQFWQSNSYPVCIKPDIVITNRQTQVSIVLDTKWKCPNYRRPSIDDLRQLYTYHHYYQASKVALIYPSTKELTAVDGNYIKTNDIDDKKICAMLFLSLSDPSQSIKCWQQSISQQIMSWCDKYND